MSTNKRFFVKNENDQVFLQLPADNRWGFTIYSDDQSWQGGFGAGSIFTALKDDDPLITPEIRESLDWIELQPV